MKESQENKIRIKDIAARAGISPGTVDRVIHNRGEVAEETRKQVMAIIEEMGYTPNLLAKSLASKKLYKIAVLLPFVDSDNPYWEKPQFGIKTAAEEIKDFNTKVTIQTFDLNSEESFIKAFKQILKEEPEGFIFTPAFYKASHEIIETCEEREIPYIFIDTRLAGCDDLAYFGQNAEQSGFIAAKLFHHSLTDNSEVLILKPLNRTGNNYHDEQRKNGFLSFCESRLNTKKIETYSLDVNFNSREELNKGIEDHLNTRKTIKGIFVPNSRAHKVAQFLSYHNRKDIMLIGYDLIRENLDFLESDTINFLLGQKPEEQGYKSLLAMFNHLMLGKTIDKTNYSPIDIILKENIDYYKNYKI